VNVNECYELMLYICAKNQSQGYLSPSDFETSFNQAQRSYTAHLLGSFASYTPGRPVARVELGNNAVVRQRLSPIIYGYNLTIDETGFTPYPGDYLQSDAMWSMYGFQRIRIIQQDSLFSVYNSVIDPIGTHPIYLLEDVGMRFYPNSLGGARMSYVRNPPSVVWGYTTDINGNPVYDPDTSTDPVFDDASILEIIVRALRIVGVNLDFASVSQYANEIKMGGQ
jgi:hypothetical protein